MDGDPPVAGDATAAPPSALPVELFNRQVDRHKLETLNDRVAALQAENDTLRARHAAREQETHEFVAYFQKEIQARDKAVGRLGEELAAAKTALAMGLEAAQRERENDSQTLPRDFGAREKLREQLAGVREELLQLEVFRDVKESMANNLRDLEARLVSEQAKAREELAALERKFIEERARLLKEHDKRIEVVKQQAKEDARNGLDVDTRKIVTDNRRMGEELRFQLQATDELQRDKEQLQARATKLHLDLQVALAKEEEYARQAQRQARETAQLKSDLRAMEQRASASLSASERAANAQQVRGEREREDLVLDADALRRLLKLKNKELRNLRRLAQTVLDQRSDVEQFFLDALAHVRREVEEERTRRRGREREQFQADMRRAIGLPAPSSSNNVKFPKLASPVNNWQASAGAAAADDKVDLRQLSWEDKERVLRLVFAKINGAQGYADAVGSRDGGDGIEEEDDGRDRALESSNNGASRSQQPQQRAGGGQVVYFATEAADPADSSETWRTTGPSEASMSFTGLPLVPRAPLKPSRPSS